MKTDEGIQLHLFDMDKYGDTVDNNNIIFVPESKTHMEFISLPFHGNTDVKYCMVEIGGYGGIKIHKWLVIKIQNGVSLDPEMFNSMTEATSYVETLTGKQIKFRHKEG